MYYRLTLLLLLFLPWLSRAQAIDDEGPEYQIFSIYFGGGSYYIDSEQAADLHKWLESIPDVEHQIISIHGHTDDIGSLEYNQWLSNRRCNSALQRLLHEGIMREQITIEEFGELNPVYDNNTWDGRRKNRRVDIIIRPVIL